LSCPEDGNLGNLFLFTYGPLMISPKNPERGMQMIVSAFSLRKRSGKSFLKTSSGVRVIMLMFCLLQYYRSNAEADIKINGAIIWMIQVIKRNSHGAE